MIPQSFKISEWILQLNFNIKREINQDKIAKNVKKEDCLINPFYITMAINLSVPLLTILVTVEDSLYLVLSFIIDSFA